MTKRKRLLPEYVSAFLDRHGKERLRYRRKGFPVYYFKSKFGTEGFRAEYRACLDGVKIEIAAERTVPGSIADLVARYFRSQTFTRGAPATQRMNRGILDNFREGHGNKLATSIKYEHADAIIAKKAKTHPAAARNLRKQLIRLFDHAIKLEWRNDNPFKLTESVKQSPGGYHTWSEDEISAFYERHPIGSKARLAMDLMLWIGCRKGDVVQLGPKNIKNGRMEYTQEKGNKFMSVRISPQLAATITAAPCDTDTFMVTEYGKPFTKNGFGGWMRKRCDEAGLPQCTSHGLRKAIARRMAEGGEGNPGIKSVGGWSGDAEVAIYTRGMDQQVAADRAIDSLSNWMANLKK